ncbi:hypothetical protein D3C80_2168320 [compost metagenome]
MAEVCVCSPSFAETSSASTADEVTLIVVSPFSSVVAEAAERCAVALAVSHVTFAP